MYRYSYTSNNDKNHLSIKDMKNEKII